MNTHNDLLGNVLDLETENLHIINSSSNNHWIWHPAPSSLKLSAAIYHKLNANTSSNANWSGWKKLWSLNIAPRVKHFVWLNFMGRLTTTDHLFRLNLGPDILCALCGLHRETINQLFVSCPKIQFIWLLISRRVNKHITFLDSFTSGSWLTCYNHSLYVVSLIAAGAWFLWKCRCDVIFRNAQLSGCNVVCKAVSHVKDFNIGNHNLHGRMLICNNFSWVDGQFLFIYAHFKYSRSIFSTGFFVSNTNFAISFTGCYSGPANDAISGDLIALEAALHFTWEKHAPIKHIFINNYAVVIAVTDEHSPTSWRFADLISNTKFLLNMNGNPQLHITPSFWMCPAISLANISLNHHTLNMFLLGRDLPYWVMKNFIAVGFHFF